MDKIRLIDDHHWQQVALRHSGQARRDDLYIPVKDGVRSFCIYISCYEHYFRKIDSRNNENKSVFNKCGTYVYVYVCLQCLYPDLNGSTIYPESLNLTHLIE